MYNRFNRLHNNTNKDQKIQKKKLKINKQTVINQKINIQI